MTSARSSACLQTSSCGLSGDAPLTSPSTSGCMPPDRSPACQPLSLPPLARRYAQAGDAAGGLLLSFTLTNLDPWNAVELGALSLPLVFQVTLHY